MRGDPFNRNQALGFRLGHVTLWRTPDSVSRMRVSGNGESLARIEDLLRAKH